MDFSLSQLVEQHPFWASFVSGFGLLYGIHKFFNLTEGILSQDTKETLALWLLEANPARP